MYYIALLKKILKIIKTKTYHAIVWIFKKYIYLVLINTIIINK